MRRNDMILIRRLLDSYESPCGVMRDKTRYWRYAHPMLRIPMWGYEAVFAPLFCVLLHVTNPHVGL